MKYLILLFVITLISCNTVAKLHISTDATKKCFDVVSQRKYSTAESLDNEFQLFLQHYKTLYKGVKREREYWTILEMKITEQNIFSTSINE